MFITDMSHIHLDEVAAIESECFPVPWTREALLKDLETNKHAIYKVAISNNKLAGYASMWHIVNEGQINNIAVAKNYRRMGVASLLLNSLSALAIERNMLGLTLEVRQSNTAAQALYHKHGFGAEGIRKNYYNKPKEDAIIMWKYF